jgi:hypothetical protein
MAKKLSPAVVRAKKYVMARVDGKTCKNFDWI